MNLKYHYTILAVDDEIFNLESLERTFRSEYQILTTTSPAEALEIFRREEIHLVIADQRMPEMSGVALLEKMKQISPHPIRIVLSAYTDISYLIDAINRGEVYRYITKPWEPNELRMSVQKALEHYQAMMDRRRLSSELAQKNLELSVKNESLENTLKELEAAQQKLLEMERFSAIGKMAGMIIHDLKQPLDIIRSAAETMARTELDSRERMEFSEMIKSESSRFLEMIQELLDYSRGSFSMNPEKMPLTDLLALTENRIRKYLENFNVDFRFYSGEEEAWLEVDYHHFQRVVLNLIKNSVEAFRYGNISRKPEIVFRTQAEAEWVVFQLQDNGPGIPEKIQKNLFTPFISGKKNFGIGLGLAIVKHIVEEHGGYIEFHTLPDQGTTFTIFLKRAAQTEPAAAPR